MEKQKISEFKREIYIGLKGLKISLTILIILTISLILFSISTLGQWYTFKALLKLPNNQVDFMALLAGTILFIAIPFTLSIQINKLRDSKTNFK